MSAAVDPRIWSAADSAMRMPRLPRAKTHSGLTEGRASGLVLRLDQFCANVIAAAQRQLEVYL